MRITRLVTGFSLCLTLSGCHSAYVEATVSNRTASPISLVEVDYPSASFGTQNLAPGADFHYRFKVLGSGPMKLLWTDNARKEHVEPGPGLKEDAEGSLAILITSTGVEWHPAATLKATPAEPFDPTKPLR